MVADAGARATGPQTVFADPHTVARRRDDGSVLLRSADALAPCARTVLDEFRQWAGRDPEHVLARQRGADGGWVELTYGEADRQARSLGAALLELGLGPDRPLMVLSENSLDHLLVTLGAMTAGVPVTATSVAYALQSADHVRLQEIAGQLRAGAVFAEDDRYATALDALPGLTAIASRGNREGAVRLDDLRSTPVGDDLEAAFGGIGPATVAKVLFTSGSTGAPKGVVTTHGMLAANQQMIRQAWPFLADERPDVVDWLPWSHTFGGSHNLLMMLTSGGAITIDDGRPAPGLFGRTLRNLREFPPTLYFNVPAGFAQLVPALEADAELAAAFFSRLRLVFNAAAALPDGLRRRLQQLGERTVGHAVPVTGSWGLTETAPAVTSAHFGARDARNIGVPLAGAEVLLVPAEQDYEIRVRGPMVTPGYLHQDELTAAAFDAEGFYRTGDAVAMADPDDPDAGLLFKGRLAEDFKLDTGTFVRVGAVRTALLSATPLLADAVVAGENRGEVCALAWVNPAEATRLLGREPRRDGELVVDDELAALLAEQVGRHNETQGSAGRISRLVLLAEPAVLDAGEITDKGYVNQRRVLARRAHLVARLYEPGAAGVIAASATGSTVGDVRGSEWRVAHDRC